MTSPGLLILALVVAIAVILFCIIVLKLNAAIGMVIACLVMGVMGVIVVQWLARMRQ